MKYSKYSIFCVSEIIHLAKKKKLQNTNQEKLFSKGITNVAKKKKKSVDIGMAGKKLICSVEVVKIVIASTATISSVNTSHLLR